MASNKEKLQEKALKDLSARAKGGIFIYVIVWLIITLSKQLPEVSPGFFYFNTSILLAIAAIRLLHLYVYQNRPEMTVAVMTNWLVYSILFAALHWGIMVAWILFDDKAIEIKNIMIIVSVAFAVGGAVTLSISDRIRIYYPLLIFCPGLFVLIYQNTPESWVQAVLVLLTLIYVYSSTKISTSDYWEAITNQTIAEDRARMMEVLSITDRLTQLKNRLYFDQKFEEEWKRGSRMNIPLSILLIDIDNFKTVNDTHGHLFGDECLRLIATTLASELLRSSDCVARYGGEEFVALLPNTGEEETKAIAEKLVKAISALSLKARNKEVDITCSIGGATTFPDYLENGEYLLRQADNALYEAKRNGRNQYQQWELSRGKAS